MSVTHADDPVRYEATVQHVAGDVALIAYSVHRVLPGPNGEWHQAFVVCSRDAGATWACLPLVRTIPSWFRHWGFPVWPPEYVGAVAIERELVRIGFRDEEVMFEPGGESMWTATRSTRGLWTVRRVRSMDYDGADTTRPPPPIAVDLPAAFRAPAAPFLESLASRLASDTRIQVAERLTWPAALLAGAAALYLGESWRLVLFVPAFLLSLPVLSILVERHRHRRTVRGSDRG